MNFETSSFFDKQSKQLSKKFNLLKSDLEDFVNDEKCLKCYIITAYEPDLKHFENDLITKRIDASK